MAISNIVVDKNNLVQTGNAVFDPETQSRFQQLVTALKRDKAVDMVAEDCYLSEYEVTDRLRLSVKDPSAELSAKLALNRSMIEIVEAAETFPNEDLYPQIYETLRTLPGDRFDPTIFKPFDSATDGGLVYSFPRYPGEDPRQSGRIVTVGPEGILANFDVWKWIINNAISFGFVPYDDLQRKALYFVGLDETYLYITQALDQQEALQTIIGRYLRDSDYVSLLTTKAKTDTNPNPPEKVKEILQEIKNNKAIPPTTSTILGAPGDLEMVVGHSVKDNDGRIPEICVIGGITVVKQTGLAFLVMQAAAAKEGIKIYINSGFRPAFGPNFSGQTSKGNKVTFYTQETLRRDKSRWLSSFKAKFSSDEDFIFKSPAHAYNPATAPPGHSNHGNGLALDLSTGSRKAFNKVLNESTYTWLVKNSWKYGFIRVVSTEEWHFEYRPDIAKNGPFAKLKGTDANLFYSDLGLSADQLRVT